MLNMLSYYNPVIDKLLPSCVNMRLENVKTTPKFWAEQTTNGVDFGVCFSVKGFEWYVDGKKLQPLDFSLKVSETIFQRDFVRSKPQQAAE